jgi:large subunit ribosomal protein L6
MSRIGNQVIQLPSGVDLSISERTVCVKGPRGTLDWQHPEGITVVTDNGVVTVARANDEKRSKAMHGLVRALLANMVVGVTDGYSKALEVRGVGYTAVLAGRVLKLKTGYSHEILYEIPAGVEVEVGNQFNDGPTPVTPIAVRGIDKQKVGQVASEIRAVRRPEPYKGKGIRYKGEQVKIKEGKRNV